MNLISLSKPVVIAHIIAFSALFLGKLQAQDKFNFTPVVPEQKQFSSAKLDSLGAFLQRAGSSSLLILKDGEVVYAWGDVDKKILVHSVRKALLNSLYGIYIANGIMDTTLTLQQLRLNDIEPALSEQEQQATIADLLKSRSGVYHSAAAVSEGMLSRMPERGSHRPNQAYYYNNWDFNALGHILEQATGESIYDLFYKHIAQPLRMDYANHYITVTDAPDTWAVPDVDGFYQYETEKSRYPAYHFRLSAKDLALYGQLFMNKGRWNGVQLVPREWITASTKPYSVTNQQYGIGYGMLWNVLFPTETRKSSSFFHTGVDVHMLGVYPASGVVLVHRVNTEQNYTFNDGNFYKMISLVWGAYTE